MAEQPSAADSGSQQPAPGLDETVEALRQATQANVSALRGRAGALCALIAADLSLARSALLQGLAWSALAIALGGSGWLLLMAVLVATLQQLGLSWLLALALATLLTLAGAAIACVAALRAFRHTRLQASRRQLAELAPLLTPTDSSQTPPCH